MKNFFMRSAIVIVLIIHILLALLVNFTMPSYKALHIVGSEVKRMDSDGFINKDRVANSSVRDVYFIYAKFPDSDKVLSFRNEDTRWGFPFYFKFDSADLQAKASAFAEEKALVEVKYYGWRIKVLDEFFNVVSIKKIASINDTSNPIVSYILYGLLVVLFIFTIIFIKKRVFEK